MSAHRDADDDDFFVQRTPSSAKKGAIVERFFKAWAAILSRHSPRLLYIDLYSGPGYYERDEQGVPTSSEHPVDATPLRVLRAACSNSVFSKALVSVFNDGNRKYVDRLKVAVQALPDIERLKYAPQFYCGMVNEEITNAFKGVPMAPALLFVDPFGYKGLTQTLVRSVLKDWGSDCILFFAYSRINRAVGHRAFDEHLRALFGEVRLATLRSNLNPAEDSSDREGVIVDTLFDSLAEIGGKYSIAYRFRGSDGRTRYFLVFTSKHIEGYNAMKESMAHECGRTFDDVATFEFVESRPEAPGLFGIPMLPRHFPWTRNWLCDHLQRKYTRSQWTFDQIYAEDNIGLPYVERNYRAAILELHRRGAVTLTRPDGTAPKAGTCPRGTLIYFKVAFPL